MKIKLHIDPKAYKQKPNGRELGSIKTRLQRNATAVSVTVEELAKQIEAGHSISPAVMKGMSASGWQEQQLFLVDIDNNEQSPIIDVEEAINICRVNKLPLAFYYYTFSHSKDKPKFRLGFVMDKPVTDEDNRQIVVETLTFLFEQSDKACINADRIFHGTNKNTVIVNKEARITLGSILDVYTQPASEKHASAKNSQAKMRGDSELDKLIQNYDFLGYLKKQNGSYKVSGKWVLFENCEICGHKDNLRLNIETNTFYCFSSRGRVGGSIIDYLMITEGLDLPQAISKFKNELCEPDWQMAIPLSDVRLPSFPVDCLPSPLKEYVSAVAESTETPVDMAAVASLAVVSSIVQGKFIIEGKADYYEPLNLYILIIAKSGERKSAIIKAMTKFIHQYEKEENEKRLPKIEEEEIQLNIWKRQIDNLEKKGKFEEAKSIRVKYRELDQKRMRPLRLIADDVTSEALTTLLHNCNGILTIISTEGGLFDTLAGRYQDTVSIDTILKAHSGDLIRVDREGRASESIDHPALTLLLTAQENVLNGLMGNEAFRSRGLTSRILFCRPDSRIGARQFDTPEISEKLEKAYKKLILGLLNIPLPQNGDPPKIRLDIKAFARLKRFFNWLEPKLAGELESIEGWGGKFVGATLRIAGLIHCVENGKLSPEIPVSENTMKRAIKIARYFLKHAKYTYSVMGADKALHGAKTILKKLEHQSKVELTKYDIFRMCRGCFSKADDTLPSIELLIENGYLKERIDNTPTGGRPKGNIYILNPNYFNNKS